MTRARALSKEKTYLCEPVAACVVEMRRVLGNETFAAVAERAGEDLAEWLQASAPRHALARLRIVRCFTGEHARFDRMVADVQIEEEGCEICGLERGVHTGWIA